MAPVEVERAVTARVAELITEPRRAHARRPRGGGPVRPAGPARWRCARAPTPWSSRPPWTGWGSARAVTAWHSAEWEPLGKPHPGRLPVDGGQARRRPERLPGRRGLLQRGHLGQGGPHAGGGRARAGRRRTRPGGASATPSSLAWRTSTRQLSQPRVPDRRTGRRRRWPVGRTGRYPRPTAVDRGRAGPTVGISGTFRFGIARARADDQYHEGHPWAGGTERRRARYRRQAGRATSPRSLCR